MTTAIQAYKKCKEVGEAIRNDATQRFPEAASPGDCWRQGDVYVTRLDSVPAKTAAVKLQLQLAPGTTKGSRHVLDSGEGVTAYCYKNSSVLQGPILDIAQERTITHPEHGDLCLPPGIYGITYARAFSDELRRQRD